MIIWCECGAVCGSALSDGGTLHSPDGCGPDPLTWRERAMQAEAAIQRVREVCAAWQDIDPVDRAMSPHLLTISKDEAALAILRALEGDGDE